MIINHERPEYLKAAARIGKNKYNGAYYYSKEICDSIIPNIRTDRNWITVNLRADKIGCDHAIFFVHNHPHCPEWYEWLTEHKDLIMVCSSHKDMPKIEHIGKPVFLPLSVDIEYVKKFRTEKTKDVAFAGRPEKAYGCRLPRDIDYISLLPREEFLSELAKYKRVYAVDRVAIEARILGCEVIPYDYESVDTGEIIDTSEAVRMLQEELDRIDGARK